MERIVWMTRHWFQTFAKWKQVLKISTYGDWRNCNNVLRLNCNFSFYTILARKVKEIEQKIMEMLFYSLEHGQFSSHPLEDFRVIMIILEGFWWCCCSLRHATFLRITIVRSNVGKIPGSLTLQRKGWKKWQPSVKNKPLTSIISYILRK